MNSVASRTVYRTASDTKKSRRYWQTLLVPNPSGWTFPGTESSPAFPALAISDRLYIASVVFDSQDLGQSAALAAQNEFLTTKARSF